MNLRDIIIKENETLLSTEGQQPHNFAAASQVGQGIEWPKATGGSGSVDKKRDEVEVPGDHHAAHHGDDHHSDGVSESIVNEVGGNYLYHGTNVDAAKKILSSGHFYAKVFGAQSATRSQTQLPVVSFTRSMSYLKNPDQQSRDQSDYEVIFVADRSRLESKKKTIGTSQTTDTRAGAYSDTSSGSKPEFGMTKYKQDIEKFKSYDVNKDGKLDSSDADELFKAGTLKVGTAPMDREMVGRELGKYLALNKAGMFKARPTSVPQNRFKSGGEFEEVVPVKPTGLDQFKLPIGNLPWQGFLVGFYLQPGTQASRDPELINHPLRLNMPRPNQFVRANESVVKEFAPAGGGTPPRGPRTPGRDPWGGNDSGEDPYGRPEPKYYSRSSSYFEQFEADHFDREDFDKKTGVFKGYWENDNGGFTQIGYFKFDDPAQTSSDDPGMGWYYEPNEDSNTGASAKPVVDNSQQRKQQELSMIDAFLKSGQTPKPGSPIYSLMKKHGMVEGIEARLNTKYSLKNMFGDVKSLDNLSLEQLNKAMDGHVKLVGRKFRSQEGNSFRYDVKLANGDWYIMHVVYVHGLIDAWLTDEENNKIPLSRISSKLSEDEGGGGGDSTSTVSSDIAMVSYPLLVRGRNRKEKRKNARAAVGQKYVPGPAYIGQGVFEGAFDSASPMTKDAVNRDRIRSLKNLIALYTEKGDKNRARELKKELELLVVERLGEASLSTMRDYFAGDGDGFDPSKLAQMRDYFNSTGDNSVIPDNIKRIIWKIKNNHNLLSQEFQQYKMWQQNRQKTQEAHVVDHQNVIYRLDPERPMSDTEVLVLGGAGRYTLDGLRRKARREADELAQDLKIEHGGSFRRAAENIRQLTNTLNTIVAAYNELRRIRKKGGRGSRGITDEEANFIRECSDQMSLLDHYTQTVKRAQRIAEGIQHYLKEDKMRPEQASIIKGMFHLNTDPGYGFYRYAIHVAGNHGGDKVVLGPNAGPFAYAYTDAEEKMIKDAVKAITGKEPMDLTGGKSEEPDFVNKNSTVPSIDWKKVK